MVHGEERRRAIQGGSRREDWAALEVDSFVVGGGNSGVEVVGGRRPVPKVALLVVAFQPSKGHHGRDKSLSRVGPVHHLPIKRLPRRKRERERDRVRVREREREGEKEARGTREGESTQKRKLGSGFSSPLWFVLGAG